MRFKFFLIRFFGGALASLPLKVLYLLADFFAFFMHRVFSYRKHVVMENLHRSFPEKSPEEIGNIKKEFYKNFSNTIFETIKLLNTNTDFLPRRIKIRNPELLDEYYKQGKSVIAVAGHFNNWEWLGTVLGALIPYRVLAVYKPLSDPTVDKIMLQLRSINGSNLIPMKSAYKEIKLSKQPTLAYLISDQAPQPDNAYWTKFLNQDTPVFLGPEKIAKATGNVVVFLELTQPTRGYYDIEVKLISENPEKEPEFSITEKHLKMLEKQIINQPAPWLWSHKRWKHKLRK